MTFLKKYLLYSNLFWKKYYMKSFRDFKNSYIYLEENQNHDFLKLDLLKNKISDKLLNIILNKIEKKDLKVEEINDFNLHLAKFQENFLEEELKKVISDIRYNSFPRIFEVIDNYKNNWYKSLSEAFEKTNFWKIDFLEWTECFWMNEFLQKNLEKSWIKSFLVRFNAWWYVDNDFVYYWHCWLILPIIWKEGIEFILLDPGIQITKPLRFSENISEKKFDINWKIYTIKKILKSNEIDPKEHYLNPDQKMIDTLSFCVENHKWVRFCFDPYNEWKNPNETIAKDFLRSIEKFKSLKHTENWELTHRFSVNLLNDTIEIIDRKNKIEEKNISFEDFLNIKNNADLYEKFSKIVPEITTYSVEDFFDKIKTLIEVIPEFKREIWSPSTFRKINLNQTNYGTNWKNSDLKFLR